MDEKFAAEEQIRLEMRRAFTAQELSERLFSRGGLFSQLASTREERAALAETELFKEALDRLSLLRRDSLHRFRAGLDEEGSAEVASASFRRAG